MADPHPARDAPDVRDEIENGLSYYRYTFLRQVPRLYAEIEHHLKAQWPEAEIPVAPVLRLGAWIGGDRDGNPFVTHDVTRYALTRQSSTALDYYLTDRPARMSCPSRCGW